MEIRNIAIIAHVDHGKTTLTDALMKQNGGLSVGVSMDSNALEQERGITIYAKNTSIFYKGTKINIVDTPGHADFGSEVERVLRSIDTVLLVVDAQEGPMPQTRFVLKKSLELGLKPIVILNKIDKPAARPEEAHEEILELFMELGANDEQLDFTTVYAIGRDGVAKMKLTDENKDLTPLLDTILKLVPSANGIDGKGLIDADGKNSLTKPLRMQAFNLGYDNFLGRMAVGRIVEGTIKSGMNVIIKKPLLVQKSNEGKTINAADAIPQAAIETETGKITKLFTFEGIARKETTEASAGDIVMIAGLPTIYIGETICSDAISEPLPSIKIDEPTISLNFLVNDSPFAGREGKFVTGRQIRERLEKELEINVGLKIDFAPEKNELKKTPNQSGNQALKSGPDFFKVYGRGELHIAILLENMRREGYELQVSQPQVIIKEIVGADGKAVKSEPFEEVIVDVKEALSSAIIKTLSERRGAMTQMKEQNGIVRMVFEVPTRALLGYRGQFVIETKGEGIFSSRFIDFRPHVGEIQRRTYGSQISMENGKVVAFALENLQERGVLYVSPGTEVYAGMIVGNVTKGTDMTVNPIKGKQLTNMRSKSSDGLVLLTPALEITIERGMEIMAEDDYLEITPKNVRLRKKYLSETDRNKAGRKGE